MNNIGTVFITFLLGNPHRLEGREGRQDRATNPDGVFSLGWGNNFDFDGGWGQGSDFLLPTISNTRVHGGATRHDSVGVQVLPDVNIALHDGVAGGLMDTTGFHSQE